MIRARRQTNFFFYFRDMKRFSISIDIVAPPQRVWQVMIDVDHWHEWTPSITSVKRLGGKPMAVGTRVAIRQPKFPAAIWKVTEIEPGTSFTWTSVGLGFRAVGRHAVEPTAAGTRAQLSLEFHGIFANAFGRLTKNITERYIAFEASGLKARSDNSAFRR
jgi:carbon monoxide dehydrogenase subunit G